MGVNYTIAFATLAVSSLVGMAFVGYCKFPIDQESLRTSICVGLLLINITSVIALASFLVFYRLELKNWPEKRAAATFIAVVNGSLLTIFIVGLIRFLFPFG